MRRPFARTRKSNRKRHNRSRSFVSERLEDRQLLAADVVGGIYNDLNGDGVRDQGEDGLANWTVYLDQNQNGTLDSGEDSTLTDADGKYSFTGLVAGNYRVAEVVRSGWTATNPTTGYVDMTLANGDERSVNFLNEGAGGTGIITGNVWRDINNDGIKDPEDTPLANWTVFMDLSGDNILDVDEPFVLTDAEGNYTFTGVLGGAGTSALDYEIAHV
ncbi:MAG: carboxypeptidase regulatory-like domain-containing protein, partial [Planctomycetales bacterium]|nr:carboxypeptidase regulatory-like domain-containing protein [Planctomycetales bacterium]